MKNFKHSKAFALACNMPTGLKHQPNDQQFDTFGSEVLRWLFIQPEIRQYIFDKLRDSGAIVFNPETKTWHGKDSR